MVWLVILPFFFLSESCGFYAIPTLAQSVLKNYTDSPHAPSVCIASVWLSCDFLRCFSIEFWDLTVALHRFGSVPPHCTRPTVDTILFSHDAESRHVVFRVLLCYRLWCPSPHLTTHPQVNKFLSHGYCFFSFLLFTLHSTILYPFIIYSCKGFFFFPFACLLFTYLPVYSNLCVFCFSNLAIHSKYTIV